MTEELRAFKVDFDDVAVDGTILCSLFSAYRPDGMPLHPEVDEVVAIYDDNFSILGQVLWASGSEVEVELIHDYKV